MVELKKYLKINAIFSVSSGFVMLLLSNSLNSLFAFEKVYIFPIIGINLLVFGAFIWYTIVKKQLHKTFVIIITILDLIWVLGSLLIVLLKPFGIPNTGNIIISLVAVWIAFLAYKQYVNTNRQK